MPLAFHACVQLDPAKIVLSNVVSRYKAFMDVEDSRLDEIVFGDNTKLESYTIQLDNLLEYANCRLDKPPSVSWSVQKNLMILAVVGWQLKIRHHTSIECRYCMRSLLLKFFEKEKAAGAENTTEPSPPKKQRPDNVKIWNDKLDAFREHQSWCPWLELVPKCDFPLNFTALSSDTRTESQTEDDQLSVGGSDADSSELPRWALSLMIVNIAIKDANVTNATETMDSAKDEKTSEFLRAKQLVHDMSMAVATSALIQPSKELVSPSSSAANLPQGTLQSPTISKSEPKTMNTTDSNAEIREDSS